jgi:hypothetical protein
MVSVFLSDNAFRITDCCGGIEIERAREQVFRFGRTSSNVDSALGVYGIGLKRAVFKIGKQIIIESRTLTGGFTVQINVDEWSADDGHWQFPISIAAPASSQDSAGTTIMINDLNPEVVMRIRNPTLLRRLSDAISSTYALFLQHFLTIELNETPVRPRSLPIASSDELPRHGRSCGAIQTKLSLNCSLAWQCAAIVSGMRNRRAGTSSVMAELSLLRTRPN